MKILEYMKLSEKPFFDNITGFYEPFNEREFSNLLLDSIRVYFGGRVIRPSLTINMDLPEIDLGIKLLVTTHLNTNKYKYEKLYKTLSLTYNPIENVDAYEDYTDTKDYTGSVHIGDQTVTTNSDVTPFEGANNEYVSKDRDTSLSSQRLDATTDKGTFTHQMRRHGNIGVTTSQQMIDAERKIANYNFCKEVARNLINDITVGVIDYEY